jgi:hypothetical protein
MLLIKPIPDINETFQSYLIRSARFNNYNFEHWSLYITQQCVKYRSRNYADRIRLIEFVHQRTGMDEVLQLFDQWMFYGNGKHYFDYKVIKICPTCLVNNKGKLMAEWSLRFNVVCSIHDCLLVDSCTNCGDFITEHTIHTMRCNKCELPILKVNDDNVEIDFFSKRIHRLFGKGLVKNRDKLIDELSWEYLHIEAFSFLVYQKGSHFWRSKRNYSIKEKYAHQLAVGQLLEDSERLRKVLFDYVNSYFMNGNSAFGTLFFKRNKYLKNNRCPALILSIKGLLKKFEFDESQTVGLTWLSHLYDIEEQELKHFIEKEFKSTLFKNRGIFAMNAYEVINAYLNYKKAINDPVNNYN